MNLIATRTQYLRNLFSGYGLMVAEVAVAFLLTPFIIGQLGAAAYGIWSLMISVIGYMGLVDVGIRGSVGRYINHYLARNDRQAVDEVVGTSTLVLTGLASLAGLASFVVAHYFQLLFAKTPDDLLGDVRFALPMMALGLWLSFVGSIVGNIVAAREQTYLSNAFGLALLIVRTGAIVVVLGQGHGIKALVLVNTAMSAIGVVLNVVLLKYLFGAATPRFLLFSASRLREIWRYSLASITSRTASTMANDSAPIIGMWLLGPEAVAIYSVAMTLTQHGRRLIDQANASIFPSVMRLGSVKDLAGLREVYLRYLDISFAIGSLVMIGLMVLSGDFLRLWVGPEYAAGAIAVAILGFGYLMQSVASTANLTLASLDRIGITVKIGIGEALACVVLTALLPGVFGLGLAGLALGTTLPRLFTSLVLYPRLAIGVLGPELKAPMFAGLRRNLLFCVGMLVLFVAAHAALPGTTWGRLTLATALVTALHLAWVSSRHIALPGIGDAAGRLRAFVFRRS